MVGARVWPRWPNMTVATPAAPVGISVNLYLMSDPRLLYRHNDDGFLIEVIEEVGMRSLYFSGCHLQSRQWLEKPWALLLPYTSYMMAFPLIGMAEPKRALLIGVGGGSIAHFLRRHFSECQLDAVDISATILQTACDFFGLQEDDFLRLHCRDGGRFLRDSNALYDLILLDAFDGDGMAEELYAKPFFTEAEKHLSKDGIFCGNLWSNQAARRRRVFRQLRDSFADTIFLPVPDRGNIISLSGASPLPWRESCADRERLAELSDRFGLDFFTMAEVTLRHNGGKNERGGFWRRLMPG